MRVFAALGAMLVLLPGVLPAQETAAQPIRPAIVQNAEMKQLDYADSLFEEGDYDGALPEYERFLERFPQSASREAAFRRRAVSLSKLHRTDEALAAFQQYLKDFPKSDKLPDARTEIGMLLLDKRELASAAETLDGVVREGKAAGPTLENALYYLGRVHFERGKWAEAAQKMNDYLSRFPKGMQVPYARYYLAECLRKQGRPQDAAPHYRELLSLSKDPRAKDYADLLRKAHYNLAEALYDAGKYAEAGQTFTAVAEAYPDWSFAEQAAYQAIWAASAENSEDRTLAAAQRFMARYPKSGWRFAVMGLLAAAQFDRKDYGAAAETYRAIISGTTDPAQRSSAQVRLLWCDFQAARYDAVAAAAAALAERGGTAAEISTVQLLWGSSLFQKGQYAEALPHFQQVTRGYPNGPDAPAAAYYGALCLYNQKQYADAARAFEEYTTRFSTQPDAASALWLAGESHRLAGNPAAAVDRLTTLLSKYPGFPRRDDALYSLFLAQYVLAKTDELVRTADLILAASHDNERAAEVYYTVALAYNDHDNYDKVVEYARKVVALPANRRTGDARYLLALALSELGKLDESAQEIKTLLLADPPYEATTAFHVWAARYLFQQEKWQDSRTLWQRLLARPEAAEYKAEALLRIGETAARLGDNSTARRQLLEFIRAYPNTIETAEAQLEVARTYAADKDWKTALDYYDKSRDVNLYSNENDQIVLGIQAAVEGAECRMVQSGTKEALRDLDLVVRLYDFKDDYTARALFRLGEALDKTGQSDKARQRWQEVVKEFPSSKWADQARARLTPRPTGANVEGGAK